MYSFDFKTKLKQLNPLIYINDSVRTRATKDFFASSLCISKRRRYKEQNYNQLQSEAREFTEAYDNGGVDEFICGTPLNWIPEHDMFDLETEKLQARGWRSILLILVKKGHISLDKARTVFQCSSLGLDEYDKLTLPQKCRWARGFRYKALPSKYTLQNY